MIRANIEDDREATMTRFLNGLIWDIVHMVELQHYVKLEDMVHMSIKVERQLKRKGSRPTQTTRRPNWRKDNRVISKTKPSHPRKGKKYPVSTKVNLNPKLAIVILSFFIIWEWDTSLLNVQIRGR